MNQKNSRVSAVIPTRNRPDFVCRAVRSVLSQTSAVFECIVVIDGPDAATVDALAVFRGTALKILALEENVGGCEARNLGARMAQGDWVALLDDDDEWVPTKIEKQLALVANAREGIQMVFCQYLDRSGTEDLVRPRRFPRVGEPISEYLWCNVSPVGGIDSPQTSTWLIRRDFFLKSQFTRGLRALQDLDWLLHAFQLPESRCLAVSEPLTIFYNEQSRDRITQGIRWQFCYEWAIKNRQWFTKKGFGFFLLIFCINRGLQQDITRPEVIALFKDIWHHGKITFKLIVLSVLYTLIYPVIRRVFAPRSLTKIQYHLVKFARFGR